MYGKILQSWALAAVVSAALVVPAWGVPTGEILLRTGSEPVSACVSTPDTLDVSLQLANLSDAVNGVQARISYDPSLLALSPAGSTEASGWSRIILTDSPAGTVTYAIISPGAPVGPGPGPYTVATLHFTSLARGTASIAFRPDSPPLVTKLTTTGLNPQTITGADLARTDSGPISIDLPLAPATASSDRDFFCADDTGDITLSATGGAGATLHWFEGACGQNPIGAGNGLVIPSPSATTTYYARWENDCGNSSCAGVTVTVIPVPTAPSGASANPDTYCANAAPATVTLSATGGSGMTLEWSTSCGGPAIGTGSPLVVAAPTGTTTYFARWTSSCGASSCASATVTVVSSPTAAAGGNQVTCAGAVVHLSGSATNYASVFWSGGAGAFNPNNTSLITDYSPTPAEIAAGTVTLTLHAVGLGPCAEATSQSVITIQPCITVNLEIPGLVGQVDEGALVCERPVEFVITACPSTSETRTLPVQFHRSGINGTAQVILSNVNPGADSVAVREAHTLRKLVAVDMGQRYDVVAAHLTPGDFKTGTVAQDNLVDIVDFSILASRWNTTVSDCGGGNPQDCPLGADSSGDGIQDTTDFTAIQINFFHVGDATGNCPPVRGLYGPVLPFAVDADPVSKIQAPVLRSKITVSALSQRLDGGALAARSADLNGDGVVDALDIRMFARARGLTLLPEFEAKLAGLGQ